MTQIGAPTVDAEYLGERIIEIGERLHEVTDELETLNESMARLIDLFDAIEKSLAALTFSVINR